MTREEIKQHYSMRDIVEKYGFKVNRAGFISCPFHTGDRSPSMKIYKDSYYCFGCGTSGDIFSFVMKIDNMTFKEAFFMLGGAYQAELDTIRFYRQRQKIKREQEQQEKQENEREFRQWWCDRLTQVCNVLRLCDNAKNLYKPFSDEWVYLYELKQKNEYKYQILCHGSKEEQEEMRRLNE